MRGSEQLASCFADSSCVVPVPSKAQKRKWRRFRCAARIGAAAALSGVLVPPGVGLEPTAVATQPLTAAAEMRDSLPCPPGKVSTVNDRGSRDCAPRGNYHVSSEKLLEDAVFVFNDEHSCFDEVLEADDARVGPLYRVKEDLVVIVEGSRGADDKRLRKAFPRNRVTLKRNMVANQSAAREETKRCVTAASDDFLLEANDVWDSVQEFLLADGRPVATAFPTADDVDVPNAFASPADAVLPAVVDSYVPWANASSDNDSHFGEECTGNALDDIGSQRPSFLPVNDLEEQGGVDVYTELVHIGALVQDGCIIAVFFLCGMMGWWLREFRGAIGFLVMGIHNVYGLYFVCGEGMQRNPHNSPDDTHVDDQSQHLESLKLHALSDLDRTQIPFPDSRSTPRRSSRSPSPAARSINTPDSDFDSSSNATPNNSRSTRHPDPSTSLFEFKHLKWVRYEFKRSKKNIEVVAGKCLARVFEGWHTVASERQCVREKLQNSEDLSLAELGELFLRAAAVGFGDDDNNV